MPWVENDSNGNTVGIYAIQQHPGQLFAPVDQTAPGYNWDATTGSWYLPLATAQANQIATLNSAYTAKVCAGVTSSATGTPLVYCAGSTIDAAGHAQSDLDALANALALLPAGSTKTFIAHDTTGAIVSLSLTAAQAQQAREDGADRKIALISYLLQQTAAVRAATTVSAVQAITWGLA